MQQHPAYVVKRAKRAVEYGAWRRFSRETQQRLTAWNWSCNRGRRRVIEFIHQDCAPVVGGTGELLPDSSRRTHDIDVGTGAKVLLSMDKAIRSMKARGDAPSFDAAFNQLINDALDRDALKLSCGSPEGPESNWCRWHQAEFARATKINNEKKSHASFVGMARDKERVREFRRKHNEILGMSLLPHERLKVEMRLAKSKEFGFPWVRNLDPLDDVYPGESAWKLYWDAIEIAVSKKAGVNKAE